MGIDVETSSKTDDTAEDDFLAELKSQFEKEIDIRKTLDNKANTMITVASGTSTLIIAIGTFLISRIVERNLFYEISLIILAIGIMLAVAGIGFFIQSYAVRRYLYAIGTDYFFDKSTGEYKTNFVNKMRNLSKREFKDIMIKGYLESIKRSAQLNQQKADAIKIGQVLLTLTIISIASLVGYILVLMEMGIIKLT